VGAEPLTLVSVVYEPEVLLLGLQATSLARYLAPDLLGDAGEILVIDNSVSGLGRAARDGVLARYGPLRDRVTLLRPRDVDPGARTAGWRGQQILKLRVAERVRTARYVVLDAKNHCVAAPATADLVTADGRPRVAAYSYRTHPLRPALERVLAYAGLDPGAHLDDFPATVTPFVLDTARVLTVVDGVRRRGGGSFAAEFTAHELTEFFLYSAWILASGERLDDAMDLVRGPRPAIWPRHATAAGCAEVIAEARAAGTAFFSVHRRALARLDAAAAAEVGRFWTERGLFPDEVAAARFVADFQATYRRADRIQKVRSLPLKLGRVPARIRGGIRGRAARRTRPVGPG
jgi:Family of unknown function (DUF6492)